MIPVKEIIITRAEGPTRLCGKKQIYKSWEEARKGLVLASSTFPNEGYDKHDFTITFEDGETYLGRLDCKHLSCPNNDLDVYEHVLSTCEWEAGRARQPHCGAKSYQKYIDELTTEETRKLYADFIDKYLK